MSRFDGNPDLDVAQAVLVSRMPYLFGVLDCSVGPEVLSVLAGTSTLCQSLYEGAEAASVLAVSPMLVFFGDDGPLLRRVLSAGWGKNWGIWIDSDKSFGVVRSQLRRLLTVETPNGSPVLFRFYDPRVLISFLPLLTPEQVSYVFANVRALFAEGRCGRLLHEFGVRGGHPRVQHDIWGGHR